MRAAPSTRPRALCRRFAWLAAAWSVACAGVAADRELETGFHASPPAAKPQVLWHWISGNVTNEGITADLEAMRRIGVGGASIVSVYREIPRGDAAFLSPVWRERVAHAVRESARLGLELSLTTGEGWSESGGPWVTPAESMQQAVWSETAVAGGQRVRLADLAEPARVHGHYRDIAVLAWPEAAGEAELLPRVLATSQESAPAPAGWVAMLPVPEAGKPEWLVLDCGRPVTVCSIRLELDPLQRRLTGEKRWQLQAGDDGQTFRPVGPVNTLGVSALPETTARYFRLVIGEAPSRTPRLAFTKIAFAGRRLAETNRLTGLASEGGRAPDFGREAWPVDAAIPLGQVVDLTGRDAWEVPPGRWTIVRFGHTSTGRMIHPVDPLTEGLECDKLSAAAVTAHFQRGPVAAVLAEADPAVRGALKGVFMDSWEAGCANWTPLMRDEFRARRGYDPLPWLPTLTGRVVGSVELTERFLWDFRRTIADLVADRHYGTLRDLAAARGLGLHAEALGTGTRTVGDQLQSKARTTIPMAEFWVNGKPRGDTKEAASAAHLNGQAIVAAEAFTAAPEAADWTNDPASLKATGDAEFTRGINRFVIHRFAHQPWLDRAPGMTLGFWGIHFERTNPWWQPAAAWMDYLARCQFLLQRGTFVADVCYYYGEGAPVELHLPSLDPAPVAGYDFDACDRETLMRMEVCDGRIVLPGGMSYRVLVLPRTDRMTLPVLGKIRELVQAGACVIGPRPVASPSLADGPEAEAKIREMAAGLWEPAAAAGRQVFDHMPLAQALGVPPDFECDQPAVRFIHRRDGAADIYFVANSSDRPVEPVCRFRIADRVPERWHPDTGEREVLAAYRVEAGRTELTLPLAPSESVFVVFRHPAAEDDPVTGGFIATDSTALVRRGSDLVLRTDAPGIHGFETASGRKMRAMVPELPAPWTVAGPWRVRFPAKSGAATEVAFAELSSWTAQADERVKYFSGTATYVTTLTPPAGFGGPGRRLWLDLGEVKNLAAVRLNGRVPVILWKPPFRLDVTDVLRAGENRLEIEITNLWPNRLIGDQRLPENQRTTWSTHLPYRADSPLLSSGLLGPVVLRVVAEVPVVPVP